MHRCLAIAKSHSIAGNDVNALALVEHALKQCQAAGPVLAAAEDEAESAPRSINVTKRDIKALYDLLSGELQRHRALVEIHNLERSAQTSQPLNFSKPLANQLSTYPAGRVDLDNIVAYPPRLDAIPVKPIFLDVAWNYIDYPSKHTGSVPAPAPSSGAGGDREPESAGSAEQKKRGWFGFGR